jgi:predicted SAM-dependent methyltransferase
MKLNKNLVKNYAISGSIIAIGKDLKSLCLNIKALILYFKNYYVISHKKNLKKFLHFGCGNDYKKGFINIDINKKADFYFDARNKLPFKNETIEYIYSSHFIEHLKNDELARHFKESFRILKPGGIYRMCAPDFLALINAYISKDSQWIKIVKEKIFLNFDYISSNLVSYGDYLDHFLHEEGSHKVFLDYERIKNLLINSGFKNNNIKLVKYNESIDSNKRENFSIYIEAEK